MVEDNNSCRDTTEQSLCVDGWTFYIPNAFTPNGNRGNEYFFGQGIGILEYEMWIFDRWGNMIFHCDEKVLPHCVPCRWDGKVQGDMSNTIVQEDVYVCQARLTNFVQDEYSYNETVTVVK